MKNFPKSDDILQTFRAGDPRFKAFLDTLPEMVFQVTSEGVILSYQAPTEEALYASPDSFLGQNLEDVLPAEAAAQAMSSIASAIETQQPSTLEYSLPISDVTRFYRGRTIPLSNDQVVVIVGDKTAEKRTEQALQLYREIVDNMAEGVFLVRVTDGQIVLANPRLNEMFGYEPGELVGQHVSALNAPASESAEEVANRIIASLLSDGSWSGDVLNAKKDGTPFWCHANVSSFEHPEFGDVWVAVHEDVTERKRAEEVLLAMSLTDVLTGIANRRRFDDALTQEWLRAARNEKSMAVLMVDIDHFKLYNDRYGHARGDDCLREVANALKTVIRRPGELVARYGGEEFAFILPATDEAGLSVAERCVETISDLQIPHETSGTGPHITVSVGFACCTPDQGEPSSDLVEAADAALYVAKHAGRNQARAG